MNQSGKYATKWLANPPRAIIQQLDTPTGPATTVNQCLQGIQSYWAHHWQAPTANVEPATRAWSQSGQPQPWPTTQHPWTVQALHAQAQQMRGSSAGPDGWTGEEISMFPPHVWHIYSCLLERWQQRGQYPHAWQHARQVTLPKKPVDVTNGACKVGDTRPITVFPTLWRIVTSVLVKGDDFKTWLDGILHPTQYGGVARRHLYQAHARLTQTFHQRKGTLVSLDYAKCFDSVDPGLAINILSAAGLPAHITSMLHHVWGHQYRHIQLNQATTPQPTYVTRSLPQGDALSPAALNIILSAAARDIQTRMGPNYKQSLFVDDRTFICHDFTTFQESLLLWERWSRTFGLNENTSKMEIVCKDPAFRRQLLAHPQYQAHVVRQARVLGVDYAQSPCQSSTAQTRYDDAVKRANRLQRAHLSRRTNRILWRTRIIPKASWGWLFRKPTKHHQAQLNHIYRQIFPGQRLGSRALKDMLEGHTMNFTFMAHYNSWKAFANTITHQSFTSPWYHTLDHWLQSLGWLPAADGSWTHAALSPLTAHGPAPQQEHLIRESWRRCLHHQYLRSARREAHTMRHWTYREPHCQMARTLYDESTSTPHHRAVLTGAAHSTAYYQKRRHGRVGTCPFCHTNQVPSWHHCCWECPHFLPRPPTPHTSSALRLGWPEHHDTIGTVRRRLDHMAKVRSICFHHDEGFSRPRQYLN